MKQGLSKIWITTLVATTLVACSANTTEGVVLDPMSVPGGDAPVAAATAAPTPAGAGAESAATALADNQETHEAAEDYVAVATVAGTSITLNGDSISVTGEGVTVAGSVATITTPGVYTLSGSLADGQIVVDTRAEEAVTLVLNGVELRSSSSAPINVINAKKTIIQLADGSQNSVTDGATYVFPSADVDEPNAAIFSTGDLTIFGGGTLTVQGNYNDGIASKDGLIIAGGTLTVNAVDDGIRGKDYLVVADGTLVVTSQGDGLKPDNDEDAARGYVSIKAGAITVTAGDDAITGETDVIIWGGTFNLKSGGGSGAQVAADASAKAIKAGVNLNIDGGVFTIDSADDALHSNGTLTINGGEFTLASGDDGVHAESALTVNAGTMTVTRSYEALESMVITLNGGTLDLTASDDGINVAGGVDGSGQMGPGAGGARPGRGQGGGFGGGDQDASTYTGAYHLYINGGYVEVNAGGDGIDVNGAIAMTDGVVVVNGPTEQMNGSLDFDGGFNLDGGFLVAAGSAGMAQAPGTASAQNGVLIFFSATQPAGTLVRLQSSDGQQVLTFAPAKDFQALAVSSADLITGATYEILLGGTSAGVATDGLYSDGAYSGGSLYATFTVAGPLTSVGTGGARPGRP